MTRMLSRWVVCLLGAGFVLWPAGAGCSSSAQPPPIQAAWEVRIGSRGGVTGGGSGHLIRSDGTVYSWMEPVAGGTATTKLLGRASREALRNLEQVLTAPELRALQYREAGNMTAVLEWRQNSVVREYSWAEQVGARPLPTPLQRAYDAARAVVTSVRS